MYGLAVVRQFEMMGIYCLNESQAMFARETNYGVCKFSRNII